MRHREQDSAGTEGGCSHIEGTIPHEKIRLSGALGISFIHSFLVYFHLWGFCRNASRSNQHMLVLVHMLVGRKPYDEREREKERKERI